MAPAPEEAARHRGCCGGCLRCIRLCCQCVVAFLTAAHAVAAAVLLAPLGPEPEGGFRPHSTAAALQEIPRVNSSELSEEDFYRRFVQAGVPVLVGLSPADQGAASLRTLLVELLADPCADRQLRLLSVQQEDIVKGLQGLRGWQRWAADLGLRVFAGVDVDGWVRQRLISLRQLHDGPAAVGSFRPDPVVVRLLDLVLGLFRPFLHGGWVIVARLVSQPVYLADRPLEEVCEEVLAPLAAAGVYTAYELHALQELAALRSRGGRRNLSEVSAMGAGLKDLPELRMFWGGRGSYSYPLHRDVSDGDILCTFYSGCKDLVILRPSARHRVARIAVPGFENMRQFTWAHDPYEDLAVPGLEGWSGTARAGEMLYLPGEMFHHIRNRCPQSLSLCRRPWRASEARDDVMAESLRSLLLIGEAESLEEGLRGLADRIYEAQG